MKQIRPFISGVAAFGIALAMVTNLAAQTVQQGFAKVVYIKGSARYTTGTPGSDPWQPLKVGTMLKPGMTVQTASGSYVDLVLNNANAVATPVPVASNNLMSARPKVEQDAIRLRENTVLSIDKLTIAQTGVDTVTDTQLDLKAGRIFGTVKKMSAASRYEIKIPNGVAGIRGTIYELSADGVLDVLDGSVWLSYLGPDGKPIVKEVPAGYEFDARTGQVTPIPDFQREQMISDASIMHLPLLTRPTEFTYDHTIYYVSPVVGIAPPPG